MKKRTEKQPIDDLFARKLSNMSLPTNSAGFDRLQARMGQNKQEIKVVFWRNPVVQRYMAAAACLVLVCLLGWQYWPSTTKSTPDEIQVATNKTMPLRPKNSVEKPQSSLANKATPDVVNSVKLNQETNKEQVARVEKKSGSDKRQSDVQSSTQQSEVNKADRQPELPIRNEPVLAQVKATESKVKPETITPTNVTPADQSTTEQVAVADSKTTSKPTTPSERVLDVTIDEPTSLVAARQAAKASVEEKSLIAVNDKPEKETKTGGLWQQVKRIKQGELFARRDNASNEDRGLLDRAYNGLKHSFEKDKSAKQ